MKSLKIIVLSGIVALAFGTLSGTGAQAGRGGPLSAAHDIWLNTDVVYITTRAEREVFLQLQTDRERDLFIEAFWRQRDPTPGAPENEFKVEHYRRLKYANQYFGRDTTRPGWQTDRGRFYILLGAPTDTSSIQGEGTVFPAIIWFYDSQTKYGLPAHFQLVFFRRDGVGEYVLYSPFQDGPGRLLVNYQGDPFDREGAYLRIQRYDARLAEASMTFIPGEITILGQPSLSSVQLLSQIGAIPERMVDPKYAAAMLKFKGLVDVEYSANYVESESTIGVFRDEAGTFFVHYSLEPKKLSLLTQAGSYRLSFALNGMVKDAQGRTVFQYEKNIPLDFYASQVENIRKDSLEVQDMIPLIPGDYTISVLMKNTISKEFSALDGRISIPAETNSLRMGNPLLGYLRKTVPPPPAFNKPFKFGTDQISCQAGNFFHQKETIIAFIQVFGLAGDLAARGSLQYGISKDGREVWSRNKPLRDVRGIDVVEEIPLAGFAPAAYQLRISLLDASGRELGARTQDFGITPMAGLPRPWIVSRVMPPSDDPEYAYILGAQSSNAGRLEDAESFLESARRRKPTSLKYALALAQLRSRMGDFGRAKEILLPFLESAAADDRYALALAGVYQALGEFREAIDLYEKAISRAGVSIPVLNALGDCHLRLGQTKEALSAWERSLAVDPKQDALRKKIEDLRKK
jgi:GWxTD domain-containing protein